MKGLITDPTSLEYLEKLANKTESFMKGTKDSGVKDTAYQTKKARLDQNLVSTWELRDSEAPEFTIRQDKGQ